MKKKTIRSINGLIVIAMMLILTACPFYTEVPISEPGEKVPAMLFGKWVDINSTDSIPDYYHISESEKGKFIFKLDEYDYNEEEGAYKIHNYFGHLSKVKDVSFMNIRDGEDGVYYLYRLEIEDDNITLKEITENIPETFETSEALTAYIEKYMDIDFFYNINSITYKKLD
ncbi:hypothetical protein ACFL6I_22915 [candidate division KSB1 bacterium]